ncbi:hypothetical protein RRG08_061830 [Elysia crispata]|uniref:Retinol dehydrogenase 13 n=1 Tax=Elysia crispata TaxID=231223 RepID=A0AAE1A360_9GAST|nr:hypothetical protein RRG08_061830 [Elysia crispata]
MPASYKGKETIEGKTVIVTGANTGIGKETVRDLAKRGGRVIMACRNMEKGEKARREIIEETQSDSVLLKELNLSSFESIQKFAKDFNETEPRLDILINNAGVMACPRAETHDGLELQLGTNHFGHFLLTNLLLDKLKACAPSRIVIVSSLMHSFGKINFDDLNSEKSYGAWTAYNQSKLANVLHALELTNRLKDTGVTANSLHPGSVNTDLQRHVKSGVLGRLFFGTLGKMFMIDAVQGAQTTLRLALDPALEQVSGKYFADCKERAASERARNEADAKRLWDVTEEIIQQRLRSANM